MGMADGLSGYIPAGNSGQREFVWVKNFAEGRVLMFERRLALILPRAISHHI